jgi:hypothetical protein
MSPTNARIQHNTGALAALGFKLAADAATLLKQNLPWPTWS